MAVPGSANHGIELAQKILLAVAGEVEFYRGVQEGRVQVPLTRYSRNNIVRCDLMTKQWRKIGRKVLNMNPTVVEEVKVAGSDPIPTKKLATLPYISPMVVFADPPEFQTWLKKGEVHPATGKAEASMRLLGFLTCSIGDGVVSSEGDGRQRVEQRIFPTNDQGADRFGIMLVMEALDELSRPVGTEFNTVTLRYGAELTFRETVDDVMTRFHWDDDNGSILNDKPNKRWMREVLSVVVGSLFYLCSTTCEADEVNSRYVAKRMKKKVVRSPISFYNVGWTTGAAISRIRQQRQSIWKESEQADIAHEQDPQHRRAYFRLQWYGPRAGARCDGSREHCGCGGQHSELIFVHAYWTHIEKLGEAGMNTGHAVPSLGRGEPRASLKTVLNMDRVAGLDDGEEEDDGSE
jgi:hypothetical protein